MKATLTIDSTEPLTIAELLRQQRGAQRAMDRTAKRVRTSMQRAVRKRMGLLLRNVSKRVDLRPARINPVRATFHVDRMPVPLSEFNATQLKRAGTRVKIGGRTKTFKGAFIATMPTGHEGVFRRRTKRRLPIRQMFGPSVADIWGDEFEEHGLEVFRELFPEQLFRALRVGRGRRP